MSVNPHTSEAGTIFDSAVTNYGPANVAISDRSFNGVVTLYIWENFEHHHINHGNA